MHTLVIGYNKPNMDASDSLSSATWNLLDSEVEDNARERPFTN